jgi:hypothetical protein
MLAGGRIARQLFGLPLVTELGPLEADSPHSVVRRAPVESHPLMTAGVQVNASMQVIRRGKLAHPNLFAAGMVIGGFASRYALCADGVALRSGHLAGLQGAAAAQRVAFVSRLPRWVDALLLLDLVRSVV